MSSATAALETTAIRIPIRGRIWLTADIITPPAATGLVLFAHGSGSSRLSPWNLYVATELNVLGMATILADLLTEEEERRDERTRELRFDIAMLTHRLVQLIDWAESYGRIGTLPLGLFGASTGAAAALDAAAARPLIVDAVVSRGRPDLARQLRGVRAPTLLIVGADDPEALRLNTGAMRQLTCAKQLAAIPGASHVLAEPGTLEAVASAAGLWFHQYLNAVP
ncbi:MAG TPA: hypothetical protein VFP80_00155 [Thermoanaerobaculia bacterium]|nr:hypothetical protein [Thermoanaerobaculia bacterium]